MIIYPLFDLNVKLLKRKVDGTSKSPSSTTTIKIMAGLAADEQQNGGGDDIYVYRGGRITSSSILKKAHSEVANTS
jgi:predicted TIM-barrel enzyme